MAGDFNHTAKDVLQELLIVGSFRGKHSTGVAGINVNSKDPVIAKSVGHPYELFERKEWDRISPFQQQIQLGHCRAATRGLVSRANAHPFHHEHIVGAHNGTMSDMAYRIAKDFDVPEYGTDSETVYAAIAKHGVENVIPNLRGAYALTWWDYKTKRLNFLRNDERPLWFAYAKNERFFFWASEYGMLRFVLMRRGVELYRDKEGNCFFELPTNTLTQYEVRSVGKEIFSLVGETELKGNESKLQVPAPFQGGSHLREYWLKEEEQELNDPLPGLGGKLVETKPNHEDPKEPKGTLPEPTGSQGGSGTTSGSSNKSTSPETPKRGNNSKKDFPQPRPLLSLVQNNRKSNSEGLKVSGPDGKELTLEQFENMVAGGCQWCSTSLDVGDDIRWHPAADAPYKFVPLCATCDDPNSEFNRYMNLVGG